MYLEQIIQKKAGFEQEKKQVSQASQSSSNSEKVRYVRGEIFLRFLL